MRGGTVGKRRILLPQSLLTFCRRAAKAIPLKHEGNIMTKLRTVLLAAAAAAGLTGIAGAMPLNDVAVSSNLVQNVRLVCDQWGRCYQTRPGLRPVGALLSDTSACLPGL
jgi:hypothetical protein